MGFIRGVIIADNKFEQGRRIVLSGNVGQQEGQTGFLVPAGCDNRNEGVRCGGSSEGSDSPEAFVHPEDNI